MQQRPDTPVGSTTRTRCTGDAGTSSRGPPRSTEVGAEQDRDDDRGDRRRHHEADDVPPHVIPKPGRLVAVDEFRPRGVARHEPPRRDRDAQAADGEHPVRHDMVGDAEPALLSEGGHGREDRGRAERERREDGEDEDRPARRDRRPLAAQSPLVDQVAGHRLQERDGGGERGQRHQDVEQRCQHRAERDLGVEQLGEGDEQHPHRGAADLLAQPRHREDDREHDDGGEQGDQGVEDDDGPRRLHDGMRARDVGPVGDHRAHADGESEEGVAQRLEHPFPLELGETRHEDEAQSLAGAAHAKRANEQQHEDAEQDGQREPGNPLDARLDAEVDDPDRRSAEQ